MLKTFPFFIWKGFNSFEDFDCVIENELSDISPTRRVESITIQGRNGTLHKSNGDYESFSYEIKDITIPKNKLSEVKKWLQGSGRLITHNDIDKYWNATVLMSNAFEFKNNWGWYYTFDITFECQPFKYKVVENPSTLSKGENIIYDSGTAVARPYFEFMSSGGDITIEIENNIFTLLNTQAGLITLDSEKGLAIFDGSIVKTRGDWRALKLMNGKNLITIDGNFKNATILKRSVWY
ncbi:phage tail protein [Carnobacterium divergens]|uniref:phage tail protein n=1 Tax=Carnobacterium divergens TaxID=2748 RepID=UPI00289190B4|nr:phage tail protein [Carnobacterium divergens]MDT2011184.1 phage tail protein [Carnobacterium divergens]